MHSPVPSILQPIARLALFGLLGVLTLAGCSAPAAKLQAGYTQMNLSGDIALTAGIGGVPLQTILNDVEDDLQLGDDSGSPYVRVDVELFPVRIFGSGFRFEESGTGQLEASFGDITAGTTVTSRIEFTNLKAGVLLDFVDVDAFWLSGGIGVDLFDLQFQVDDTSSIVEEDIDEFAPIPAVFAQTGVDLDYVELMGEVGWMSVELDDFEGEILDLEFMAEFRLYDPIHIFAGYRYIDIDLEGAGSEGDFRGDLELQGWILGGSAVF